jgi:hypothetical protein
MIDELRLYVVECDRCPRRVRFRRVKGEGKRVELPKGWEERLSSGCCHYLHLCPDCVAKGDP